MRVGLLAGLLIAVLGCASSSHTKSAQELAKVRREREEYAARLEESQTLLNYTRWQLAETKKALNGMYAWEAAAATQMAKQQDAVDWIQMKRGLPIKPPSPPEYTVENPPPNWWYVPEWREKVMKYRTDLARKRHEDRRPRTQPTTTP